VPDEQHVAPVQLVPPHWPYRAEQLPVGPVGGFDVLVALLVVVLVLETGGGGVPPSMAATWSVTKQVKSEVP
jgi:hypothetical protein